MKVGILTTYLALGEANDSGLGQHFRILADALVEDGHVVHVIHPQSDPRPTRVALEALAPKWTWEVPEVRLPRWIHRPSHLSWSSLALLSHLWTAWKINRQFGESSAGRAVEIIETHSYNIPAFFLSRRRIRPRLVTRVATTMSQMVAISPIQARALQLEARLERRAIRLSDALVTHTREHRDIVCANEKILPSRFQIVPHGVVDNEMPPLATKDNGIEDGQITFLFVGRFEFRKGIDILLAAIPTVAKAFPLARFILAGDHGDGADWHAFCINYPALANTRVKAVGRVSPSDLLQLYRLCDVFVAPSRYESFGLIYAEAMSHGKPVIGSRSGGIPEVVQANVTGLLAEPGDVASLVSAMRQLAGDASLRHSMGIAARADFLKRFSAAQLAKASACMYRKILAY